MEMATIGALMEPERKYDYVLKSVNHPHAHEVCRKVRPRNCGYQIEVEFANGDRSVVPRRLVKNISPKRLV